MRLLPHLVPDWPKLAWVAVLTPGGQDVLLYHGPMVEVREDWAVEAVWAGDFAEGDFDRTGLVFGSGVRLREGQVVFVSSGTVFDRLWQTSLGGCHYVANTLPGLLSVTGQSLRDDYLQYSRDIRTITRGLDNYVREFPTDSGNVRVTYYSNLVWDGRALREIAKPDTAPSFASFEDYRGFLTDTAERLGANAVSEDRRHPVRLLSTISSGYDSTAAAVISRHAGCRETVTIAKSTSLWRGSDSGAAVAEALGMSCREYPRTAKEYPLEEALWAAEGRPGILNWTLFDYPEPLCLLFTGCHGEKMWDRVSHDHPDPFVRRDPSSLGFCEFRLIRGVFQCVVPFWGVRHSHELHAITAREMASWATGKDDYDKPIPRRIVEEAGVPRSAFGVLNKNTSLEAAFRWPYSSDAMASFSEFLRQLSLFAPPGWLLGTVRRAVYVDNLICKNILSKLRLRRGWRPWDMIVGQSLIFQWANAELKRSYESALGTSFRGIRQ